MASLTAPTGGESIKTLSYCSRNLATIDMNSSLLSACVGFCERFSQGRTSRFG